jgi:DNA-binding beta-propeller fold protein YncE
VQYSTSGAVQHNYTISGLVDGLKFNPVTGMVWALQNNDGNATLSIIDPITHTVSGPLSYAAPPYV